jgi:hypothetical protein
VEVGVGGGAGETRNKVDCCSSWPACSAASMVHGMTGIAVAEQERRAKEGEAKRG